MQHTISRRQMVQRLGLIAAGLATACTPVRVLVSAYPQVFDDDPDLVDRVLRAFVTTVIPGAPADDPDLARAHTDSDYPFAQYAAFFAADLSRRGHRHFGEPRFDRLTLEQRTAVVCDGLSSDATTRKLYQGAITLAQIAFYAGIYDDAKGCALITFDGRFRFDAGRRLGYDDPEQFLPRATTADGNAA